MFLLRNLLRPILILFVVGIIFCGCSTDNIDERKQEKWLQYASLPYDVRSLVDQRTICQGMTSDAVYIAFGEPNENFADLDSKGTYRWIYGEPISAKKPKVFFKEFRKGDKSYLQKCKKDEKDQNIYSRAEIVFSRDRVIQWQLFDKKK